MNRLERMGWAIAAQELLGIRKSEALMLRTLVVDHPGRIVSHDALAGLTGTEGQSTPANLRVITRIGFARRALVDIGFSSDCITALPAEGYSIDAQTAALISSAVVNGRTMEAAA